MEIGLVKYFMGVGGTLLVAIVCMMIVFACHCNSQVTSTRVYQAIGLTYLGIMVGLSLIVVGLPVLCLIRSTLMCYRIM